jgi:hypothetical protein
MSEAMVISRSEERKARTFASDAIIDKMIADKDFVVVDDEEEPAGRLV